MEDKPIVCTLTPELFRVRREGVLSDLVRRADGRDAIADGIRFRFPATSDALATLARVIEAERQCCRFLRFSITVEPDGGPIYFDLTGPAGTREFLNGLLAE